MVLRRVGDELHDVLRRGEVSCVVWYRLGLGCLGSDRGGVSAWGAGCGWRSCVRERVSENESDA